MLTASALVCKSWLPLSRRLLYHLLIVEGSCAYASRKVGILRPEALLHRSHLLGFVRSLSIRTIDESTATLPNPQRPSRSFATLHREVKNACEFPTSFFYSLIPPGSATLRLSVHWAPEKVHSFKPHILDWLLNLILPIEVLDLRTWETL